MAKKDGDVLCYEISPVASLCRKCSYRDTCVCKKEDDDVSNKKVLARKRLLEKVLEAGCFVCWRTLDFDCCETETDKDKDCPLQEELKLLCR